jgi:hypothetical protein
MYAAACRRTGGSGCAAAAHGGAGPTGIFRACCRAHLKGCYSSVSLAHGSGIRRRWGLKSTSSVVFHAEYDAGPVLVVRHLIADGERLGRARRPGY